MPVYFLKKFVLFIWLSLLFACTNKPVQNSVVNNKNDDSSFALRVLCYNLPEHAQPIADLQYQK